MLRSELLRAEGELEDRCWAPPSGLQQWLQLTHELEHKAYIKKKVAAEVQLQQAREACEKLRKKRSSLIGAFASTHGKSIDDVDRSIVEARYPPHLNTYATFNVDSTLAHLSVILLLIVGYYIRLRTIIFTQNPRNVSDALNRTEHSLLVDGLYTPNKFY